MIHAALIIKDFHGQHRACLPCPGTFDVSLETFALLWIRTQPWGDPMMTHTKNDKQW